MDILIVEDEESIREYYKAVMIDIIDTPMFRETGSIEGLEEALQLRVPDILILDCNLVDGNGYSAYIELIHEYSKLEDTIKFFISGVPYADMVIDYSPEGAKLKNGYILNKPVLSGLIRMIVNRHLESN